MPTLNRYTEKSEKEGFYVRANVGGESPVTLQVTALATQIFKSVGYEDGDSIPTKLVWAMYDLDMLYTLSSIDLDSTPDNIDPSTVLRNLDIESELTEEERARLISYLEAYTGPNADHVTELREQLLENISEDALEAQSPNSGKPFLNFGNLPNSAKEIAQHLDNWTSPDFKQRVQKALLLKEGFLKWSVRTFALHPRLVDTPLIRIENEEITYQLEPSRNVERVTITDARGHQRTVPTDFGTRGYDYRIERTLTDGTMETAYVRGEHVVNYDAQGEGGSRIMFTYSLEDILPPRYSYFGGTDDEEHTAKWLQEEYLSLPLEELERRMEKFGAPEEYVEYGDDRREQESGSVPQEVVETIESMSPMKIVEVDRISNSKNPIISPNQGTMVVVTGRIRADEGDRLVVREKGEFTDSQHIERAVRLDEVPSEGTRDWLQSNL